MTFFLVIDLVIRIIPFFSHIFRMFTMLNVVYDHFLTRKTQFFTLFMLSRTSDNTTSQNIGGTNAWAVPPPQIFGGTVPQSPLGLRHCALEYSFFRWMDSLILFLCFYIPCRPIMLLASVKHANKGSADKGKSSNPVLMATDSSKGIVKTPEKN